MPLLTSSEPVAPLTLRLLNVSSSSRWSSSSLAAEFVVTQSDFASCRAIDLLARLSEPHPADPRSHDQSPSRFGGALGSS